MGLTKRLRFIIHFLNLWIDFYFYQLENGKEVSILRILCFSGNTMIVLFVTIYWNLLFGCNGESIDLNMDVNRQDWLDPNDPFAPPSFCTEDTLNQLAICEGQLQKYLKGVSFVIVISGGKDLKTSLPGYFFHSERNLLLKFCFKIYCRLKAR